MTTRASAGVVPRSFATKRRTLAYRAVKPWSSTRSCQIATALRPRPSASTISSRYGSQALALGARPGRGTAPSRWTPPPWWPVLAGSSRWTPPRKWPVLTAEVGGHLRRRNCRFWFRFARAAPAAHRDARRPQVAADRLPADARRLLDPRAASSPDGRAQRFAAVWCRPRRCSCREGSRRPRPRQRLGRRQLIAGFEVSINCRFWVSTEAQREAQVLKPITR